MASRRLLTNMSKGELDPLVEGRPDLAAYFEGGSEITNFLILRQGGLDRRVGTRKIVEIKDSTKDAILIPFESSINDAAVIEMGPLYSRFVKNKAQILNAGIPVEIVTPYTEARLREIHFTQSVDVLFTFQGETPQQKLAKLSDTNWTIVTTTYSPPPSFEEETDISGGVATLTPGATSGNGVTFTASVAAFLPSDIGRTIIFGLSRAVIRTIPAGPYPVTTITADILDVFPNTSSIPAGSWLLRNSPQIGLNFSILVPVGSETVITPSVAQDTFRVADVGKFIVGFGGLVKIHSFISAQEVRAEILSELNGTPPILAGNWSLEIAAWSAASGYTRTGEFYQGRLAQASTRTEPTTFWLSSSDDFDNYAVGIVASKAIEDTIASRQLNRIEWLADNGDLFVGTTGSEFQIHGAKPDEPLGGDSVPLPVRIDSIGSYSVQPITIGHQIIMVDRSGKMVYAIAFDFNDNAFSLIEITGAAGHIMGSGIRTGPIAFAKRPDPRIYFVRKDGQLVTLTYFRREKVVGFTRLITDGTFESVAVIPQSGGLPDQVYVIVKRNINGIDKKFIELFDTETTELTTRDWTSLQTDCATVYNLAGVPTTVLTGLNYLEGKTVNVITDGEFRGTKIVTAGQITLTESASQTAEVGLNYNSKFTTMRPAIEGTMVEGIPRAWLKLWIRVRNTIGGKIQGENIIYPADPLDTQKLKTGDYDVTPQSTWNTDGRITIEQTQPYPMTLLAIFGDIQFGEHG